MTKNEFENFVGFMEKQMGEKCPSVVRHAYWALYKDRDFEEVMTSISKMSKEDQRKGVELGRQVEDLLRIMAETKAGEIVYSIIHDLIKRDDKSKRSDQKISFDVCSN